MYKKQEIFYIQVFVEDHTYLIILNSFNSVTFCFVRKTAIHTAWSTLQSLNQYHCQFFAINSNPVPENQQTDQATIKRKIGKPSVR